MVAALTEQQIDGFCVGGPWNTAAVRTNSGVTVIAGKEIWHNRPEKVLGLKNDWAQSAPHTLCGIVQALQQACDWLATWPNRFEVARWLSQPNYINTDLDRIAPTLLDICLVKHDELSKMVTKHTPFNLNDQVNNNQFTPEQITWITQHMQACGQIQHEHQLTAAHEITKYSL